MAILGNYKDNFETVFEQSYILDIIGQLSTISMVIIGNYKVNYDTATATVNKSMSFDLLFSLISE